MQILFLQGNISGEVVTWHLKQQPDICLPSVNTGCLDTISTPGPDLWIHQHHHHPQCIAMSYLLLADQDLAPVRVSGDHRVLLEHLVVVDAAVEGHVDGSCGR